MAKVVGVDTQIRGKLGARIYQVLNGEQIVKTFAIPSNPESSGQTAQRGVFRDIIACFKVIADGFINLLWNPFTSGNKTGWGNFISANLLSMGKVAFDATDAVLSEGSLEPIYDLAATYDTATGAIEVTFDDAITNNGHADDWISFVAVDATLKAIISKTLDAEQRNAESASLVGNLGSTATDVELFAVVHQQESSVSPIGLVSNSVHVTCTAAA